MARGNRADEQIERIGWRLRQAREALGLTIPRIAELTGLTKGFLSQVERGKTSASVSSLVIICDALHLSISDLFLPPSIHLVRSSDRHQSAFAGDAVEDYILSPSGQGGIQVIESAIQPGGGNKEHPYRVPADRELVYVIEGVLSIMIDDQEMELAAGDSLSFRATLPHSWSNDSQEMTRVLWILTTTER